MRIVCVVSLSLIAVAFPVLAAPERAQPTLTSLDGTIEIYPIVNGSPQLGSCDGSTTFVSGQFGFIEFAVMMRPNGATLAGISAAEFYLSGLETLPGNWMCTVTPEPDVTYFGNICNVSDVDMDGAAERRGQLVFNGVTGPLPEDGCRVGDADGLVRLATVRLSDAIAPTIDLPVMWVSVVAPDPPSSPLSACPNVNLCNAPVFTPVCVTGSALLINSTISTPSNPLPSDGATGVNPIGLEVSWAAPGFETCTLGVEIVNVYFGTDPDPPLVSLQHTGTTYFPGSLVPLTTYYWRVSRTYEGTTESSPVWSFTTGLPIAVEATTWAHVKNLFR